MGTYDRDGLLAFAARPDLPASVFIREERLRGRPWFVLIHSLYPSYAEAESARDSLPEDLSKLDTWIRRLPADAQLEAIPTGRAP
jgi:DamX protein